MEVFGEELRKKKKEEKIDKIAALWKSCSCLEQFFIELSVKVPEASWIDVFTLKKFVFAKCHPFWGSMAEHVVAIFGVALSGVAFYYCPFTGIAIGILSALLYACWLVFFFERVETWHFRLEQ